MIMPHINKNGIKVQYRQHYAYFYELRKQHKIGMQQYLGYFHANNGEEYSVFVLGYYKYVEPHIVILNNDISSIMFARMSDFSLMKYIGENKFDVIGNKLNEWLNEKHSVFFQPHSWLKRKNYNFKELTLERRKSLIYEWYDTNPNYRLYKKIWRKNKHNWYGKNNVVNYKHVVEPYRYSDWQDRDPWFLTNKDIKQMKKDGWWSDRFEYPNIVEHYYDGEEPYGYWSNHIEENVYKN